MEKTFQLKDLDCANCAAKMERGIQKLDGVKSASINFMRQRLTIDADEARFGEIMRAAADVCRRVEKNCEIVGI